MAKELTPMGYLVDKEEKWGLITRIRTQMLRNIDVAVDENSELSAAGSLMFVEERIWELMPKVNTNNATEEEKHEYHMMRAAANDLRQLGVRPCRPGSDTVWISEKELDELDEIRGVVNLQPRMAAANRVEDDLDALAEVGEEQPLPRDDDEQYEDKELENAVLFAVDVDFEESTNRIQYQLAAVALLKDASMAALGDADIDVELLDSGVRRFKVEIGDSEDLRAFIGEILALGIKGQFFVVTKDDADLVKHTVNELIGRSGDIYQVVLE